MRHRLAWLLFVLTACSGPTRDAREVAPAPSPAPVAEASPFALEARPRPILGGRVLVRLPNGGEPREAEEGLPSVVMVARPWRAAIDLPSAPLRFFAEELLATADGDLRAGVEREVARAEVDRAWTLEALPPNEDGTRVVLARADPPRPVGGAEDAFAAQAELFVRLPDRTVVRLGIGLEPAEGDEASVRDPRLVALARAIAPTLAAGPTRFETAEGTRFIQLDGDAYLASVPEGYGVVFGEGVDTRWVRIARLRPLGGAPSSSLTLDEQGCGALPRDWREADDRDHRDCRAERTDRLFDREVVWHEGCPDPSFHHVAATHLEHPPGVWCLFVDAVASTDAERDALRGIARGLRDTE